MTYIERSNFQPHPFHLVDPSPWPLTTSISLGTTLISLGFLMHGYIDSNILFFLNILSLILSMTFWFRDMIAEGTYLGNHTLAVRNGLNLGFLLFIISEILIFASLFWIYFYSAIGASIEIGGSWPPLGIESVKPTELPLLNTIILLASGATITFSHHGILNSNRKNGLLGLILTIWLIIIFVLCQIIEYKTASFTYSDGIYGAIFYSATALHFIHMNMLIIMLIICYWRLKFYHITNNHHVGLETTIAYVHVLDVIWLFIYVIMYFWGN